MLDKNMTVEELLSFYMGKNTPVRQEFIINNLTQGNSPFFGAEDQIIQPIQKEELPFEDTVDTPQNIIEDDSDEIVEDEDSE